VTLTAAGSLLELVDLDPYGHYEELRATGEVVWDDGLRAWLALSYEACATVERREELFAPGMGTLPGAEEITGRRSILTLTGGPHRRLHSFLRRALAPQALEPLRRDFLRPLVERHVADLAAAGGGELFEELAVPLPVAVVAHVLGLPFDREQLRSAKRFMDAVLAWRHSYGDVPELVEAARAASRELDETLAPVVSNLDAGLVGELRRAGPEVLPDWDERDLLDQCKVLFEAGSETTSHLIATCLFLLLTDDGLRARVDRDALPRFVDEALRAWTVVHMRVRVATRDVELGGARIRRGDRVHPVNAAGNRDPARFDRPAELDLDRSGWASHLAFNVGPRHCVGAALARLEAQETLDVLLDRLPGLRLDPAAPPPAYAGFVARSFRPLHMLV
jgi:hypothetical protein